MKKATLTKVKSRPSTTDHSKLNHKLKDILADKNELETFFRVLFKNATEGFISLRAFTHDHGLAFKSESYLFNDNNLFSSAERLANIAAGKDNAVFCTPISTFKGPNKATGDEIANGIAISVDFDEVDPQKSKEILEKILGPATLIIASGGKWTDNLTGEIKQKLHMHWRLTNPTTKFEDHEGLKKVRKKAAEITGGDLSASHAAHPMRLSGSWHTKTEPTMCSIIECREQVEVLLEEAEAALGIKTSLALDNEYKHKFSTNTAYGLAAFENETSELLRAPQGTRNACLNKAAFCLGQLVASKELDESNVCNSLLSIAISIGLSESEARATIDSGLKKGILLPRINLKDKKNSCLQTNAPSGSPFPKLRTGAEIRSLDIKIEWLIDGIIPKNAATLFFGRGGIGKMTLSMQMCNAIASGKQFLGKASQKTTVIYVDYENSLPVLSDRLKMVGADEVLFWSSADDPKKLDQHDDVYLNLLYENPNCLFVFDTLRSAQDGDENDSRFMAAVMKNIRKLRDKEATIILLHHTKKGVDDVYKGSTAIFDLVDHVLGLYPIKKEIGDKESDEKIQKTTLPRFFFGTKDKTRFKPSSQYLRFDNIQRLFVLSDDPEIDFFLKIQELIPETGIIQTNLLLALDTSLGIKKEKARQLLKDGINRYWSAEKNPLNNNAITYKPVSGFLDPLEKGKPENVDERR